MPSTKKAKSSGKLSKIPWMRGLREGFAPGVSRKYAVERWTAMGFDLATCHRINSASICEGPRWASMVYCRGSPRRCHVVADAKFLTSDSVYIDWYNAEPRYQGYGSKFFRELEKYLREKRCVKRINLHSVSDAEEFWLARGLDDVPQEWYDEKKWVRFYNTLRPMTKVLHPPKNCKPRGWPVGQQSLRKWEV